MSNIAFPTLTCTNYLWLTLNIRVFVDCTKTNRAKHPEMLNDIFMKIFLWSLDDNDKNCYPSRKITAMNRYNVNLPVILDTPYP